MSAAEKHDPVLLEIRDLLRQLVHATTRELLTIQEAAQRLHVDRTHLGKLVAKGLVRTVPHRGGKRIPLEEVKRLALDGLPELPRRGRPRKAARRPSEEIMAIPIPIATSARGAE